jgi:hypothetical protein
VSFALARSGVVSLLLAFTWSRLDRALDFGIRAT